jgi:hypothetical protein
MKNKSKPSPSLHMAELEKLFKIECHDRSDEIDPFQSFDWLGLTVGWAVAKGLDPEKANAFAIHIRYSTTLG